ncbi:PD-(D/E)XK nuclease superfamily protein [Desulfonauticus submarinus]|uniref:PD-(D/E)XK nuclease superfamily protein n=1 Tax=Desulfonauticus submarinus TaxID=206665 RepID=A0A1H0DH41_9BACT|nr:ATP-binding protein [Desulfonauticus submarinus]SDN69567.1 PD-(D/E)XK nuclease superfamily protein [Desulfonauticus submarinus]
MQKLPIGLQSFKALREDNYLYVDKTFYIKELVDRGKYYFLSRPRRFGKSLFLDTLRQAFLGRKKLFEGLYLYERWDWEKKYPVIHISFGAGVMRNLDELRDTMESFLIDWKNAFSIIYEKKSIKEKFKEAIQKAAEKYNNQVVVLIDEYDKPILDNITELNKAKEIREELKNFYSVLKDSDEYLKFVFITGVTKFSKVSIFSGLNNLDDITLERNYATICGYTQSELEKNFADRLKGVDLSEVRRWYNGYSWGGEKVYNPFDILLFLSKKQFQNYWFETGTPTFLIKMLDENKYYIPRIEEIKAGGEIISSFELEALKIETLLYQTGYLTIEKIEEILPYEYEYHLTYPNLEVKKAFTDSLLTFFSNDLVKKSENKISLVKKLRAKDFEGLREVFYSFFASIPNDWYRKNQLSGYEGFYASIFYCYFTALGLEVKAEDATNQGRLDMAVFFEGSCYIFEFKVVELIKDENSALTQIKTKGYADKYKSQYDEIYLIGVEFSKEEKNIVGYEVEKF